MLKPEIKQPREFSTRALDQGLEYYDYTNRCEVVWKSAAPYVCLRKIGRGKYSEVFEGLNLNNGAKCAIKVLKPNKLHKVYRELMILKALQDCDQVIKLLDLVSEQTDLGTIYAMVFEYVPSTPPQQLVENITPDQCRFYLLEILKGLHFCHSRGIMHRDIKLPNIMIDNTTKKLRIIDWGLGEFYLPSKDYFVLVASRYFKGPELLLSYNYYHYSLDIWSLGCVMAGLIFHAEPFFQGSDNVDQLMKIRAVLGSASLSEYIRKYNIEIKSNYLKARLNEEVPLQPWASFINDKNRNRATQDAIDLLSHMLVYDHDLRPTAEECMVHPYFNKVREQSLKTK